jgi:hypothetical protein
LKSTPERTKASAIVSVGFEEYCFLGCYAILPDGSSQTFRRKVLPTCSGSKISETISKKATSSKLV